MQDTYPQACAFRFGDNESLCNELLGLVRNGMKTATCEALSVYLSGTEPHPQVGRCDIALNWDNTPALVIRTTSVESVRFCDVTASQALAEGENDTLEGWRRDHKAYFSRTSGFSEDMMLLFERFELIEDLERE